MPQIEPVNNASKVKLAPIGAAAFNNEFGRPNIAGYLRTFESCIGDVVRGYHKPIMVAGGFGNLEFDANQWHQQFCQMREILNSP